MLIEIAEEKDIEELYALQLLAFESEAKMIGSRAVPALMESLDKAKSDFHDWLVLKTIDESGRIIGSVRCREENGVVEVGRLMVHPDFRRRGIGESLLKAVVERFSGELLELFTCTNSVTNIRLYEKVGYRKYREEGGHNGLSFVYMRKNT